MSRWGYRRLLRTAQHVFKEDAFAVQNARQQLREEFFKNQNVNDPTALGMLLKGIDEIDEMLRFNVVQGKMNTEGNFAVSLEPEHCVTIEAGQDDPHGPELAMPDTSLLGKPTDVKVQKTKAKKVPYEEIR
jgi:hypothetical protein